MRFAKLIFISCALCMGLSCKKDEPAAPDVGYTYFPDVVGSYVIYNVDSIHFDDFKNTTDTIRFELKEVIESVFPDNAGRTTMRIERYKKFQNEQSFRLTDVWMANRNATNAERVEEDVRFVKLAFPVAKGKRWNGNAFNTMDELTYEIMEINKPFTLGSLTFDSTLTVQQEADSNLIEKRVKNEVYAKNIGLIYKKYIDVVSKDSVINFNVPFEQRITSGVKVTYTLKAHGK